ncbi:uncharacterized protein METZ01_LOCUS514062, partial [marine metagenome]
VTNISDNPWIKHYPDGVEWDAPIHKCSLYSYIETSANQHGTQPAIDFLDRKTTYSELRQQIAHAARGLQELGAKKGTRIGLCLPNTPYSVIFYFATLKIGGTVVNFNPLYVEKEIAYQI